ncbi:MAG: hypothetical protein RR140_02130 [Clostridia bacterium]
MKRTKLVATICALAIGIFALTYGVLAATSLTFNISANVSFTATEAFGDIKVGMSNAYRKSTAATPVYSILGATTTATLKNTATWYPWKNADGQQVAGTKVVGNALETNLAGDATTTPGTWSFPATVSYTEGLYFDPASNSVENASIVVSLRIANNSASGPVIFYQPEALMSGTGTKIDAKMILLSSDTAGTQLAISATPGAGNGAGYYISIPSNGSISVIIVYSPKTLGASFASSDNNAITLAPTVKLATQYTVTPANSVGSAYTIPAKVAACIADMTASMAGMSFA